MGAAASELELALADAGGVSAPREYGARLRGLLMLGVIGLAEVIFLAGHQWATGVSSGPGLNDGEGGNVERVARSLFTDFLWPFEITAILLVVAVVGGVVLARRSGLPPEQEYELERDDDETTPSNDGSTNEVTTP